MLLSKDDVYIPSMMIVVPALELVSEQLMVISVVKVKFNVEIR